MLEKISIKVPFLNRFKRKNFYAKLVHKDDLCFDIGANIGVKSKILLSIGAKVIAFEPQSSCNQELLKITHSNFSYFPFAVGSQNEEKELYLSNHSEVATLSHRFIEEYSSDWVYWKEKEVVQVRSINYLIERFGIPNYCKIDVEGYELDILLNLSYHIPIIEFEFTEKFLGDTTKIIEKLGFDYEYNFTVNEGLKFQLNNWVHANEIKSMINSLPKHKLHGNLFCKKI